MAEKKIKNLTDDEFKELCAQVRKDGKDCSDCQLARIEKTKVVCIGIEMNKTVKIGEFDREKTYLFEKAKRLVGKRVKVLVNDVIVKDKIPNGMCCFYYGFLDIVDTTHIIVISHCGRTLIRWESISKLERIFDEKVI